MEQMEKEDAYRLPLPSEKLIIRFVDELEIVHLGDVYGHLVYILKAAARSPEYFSQVTEGLSLRTTNV